MSEEILNSNSTGWLLTETLRTADALRRDPTLGVSTAEAVQDFNEDNSALDWTATQQAEDADRLALLAASGMPSPGAAGSLGTARAAHGAWRSAVSGLLDDYRTKHLVIDRNLSLSDRGRNEERDRVAAAHVLRIPSTLDPLEAKVDSLIATRESVVRTSLERARPSLADGSTLDTRRVIAVSMLSRLGVDDIMTMVRVEAEAGGPLLPELLELGGRLLIVQDHLALRGLLAGLDDARKSRALALLRADPARHRQVAELAILSKMREQITAERALWRDALRDGTGSPKWDSEGGSLAEPTAQPTLN